MNATSNPTLLFHEPAVADDERLAVLISGDLILCAAGHKPFNVVIDRIGKAKLRARSIFAMSL